jgi:hypothetical protein
MRGSNNYSLIVTLRCYIRVCDIDHAPSITPTTFETSNTMLNVQYIGVQITRRKQLSF